MNSRIPKTALKEAGTAPNGNTSQGPKENKMMARSGTFNKERTTAMHTTVTKDDGTRLIVEVRSEASVTIAWEVDDEWRETGACAACGETYRADAVPSNEHRPICPNCGVDLNPSLT